MLAPCMHDAMEESPVYELRLPVMPGRATVVAEASWSGEDRGRAAPLAPPPRCHQPRGTQCKALQQTDDAPI